MRRYLLSLLFILSVCATSLCISSCGNDNDNVPTPQDNAKDPDEDRDIPNVDVISISLDKSELSLKLGEKMKLKAVITPENATNKQLLWSSSDSTVVIVDSIGVVSGISQGIAVTTCVAEGGNNVKAEVTVTIIGEDKSGSEDGHDYVDLGLPSGTLWATCNIGADNPEAYGQYFAWGEIKSKLSYAKSAYKWYDKSVGYSKYCSDSYWGNVDNKNILDSEDDAATANWGKNWCMPLPDQFGELSPFNNKNITTEYTVQNGIYGELITSKINGNTLFLPMSGYGDGNGCHYRGTGGYYWSRMSTNSVYVEAYYMGQVKEYGENRFLGMNIRPVRSSQ